MHQQIELVSTVGQAFSKTSGQLPDLKLSKRTVGSKS